MISEAQKRAANKYQKQNIRRVVLKLNKKLDQDIIQYLDGKKNVQGTLKEMIRRYMNE